jgi:hypothetical protein
MMEWISVNDQLPERGVDVLVTDGDACMVSELDSLTGEFLLLESAILESRKRNPLEAIGRTSKAMTRDHPEQTVGRQFPKQWIIGKTLEKGKFVSKTKQHEIPDHAPRP